MDNAEKEKVDNAQEQNVVLKGMMGTLIEEIKKLRETLEQTAPLKPSGKSTSEEYGQTAVDGHPRLLSSDVGHVFDSLLPPRSFKEPDDL